MDKKTLTIKEAAAVLGVGPQTMYNISHREDFYPLVLIGRKRLVLTHLLDKWLEEQAGQKEA
ncbi:helix-turn-helix domain-containing protein [Ruminococcaceae bacterium OttesenSCG-928-D13]|nr:helix-turn-helix domain-containing protein [Ruminococcaceae bacterium OttesenSCG-928-D13]